MKYKAYLQSVLYLISILSIRNTYGINGKLFIKLKFMSVRNQLKLKLEVRPA